MRDRVYKVGHGVGQQRDLHLIYLKIQSLSILGVSAIVHIGQLWLGEDQTRSQIFGVCKTPIDHGGIDHRYISLLEPCLSDII